MSFKKILLSFIIFLLLSISSYGQDGSVKIEKIIFISRLENINYHRKLNIEEQNRKRQQWLKNRQDDLQNEKLKRDRKIELDIQYMLDSAKIDKKPIDIDEINMEKVKRLKASQLEYEERLKKAVEQAKPSYYHPPKEDYKYSVTFLDKRISKNVWVDVFIDTEDGLEPFQTSIQEHRIQRWYKIKNGSIELHFSTLIPTERYWRQKMEPPVGNKIIVFVASSFSFE